MEIKTKFNINDEIWTMADNKAVTGIIKSISINIISNKTEINYVMMFNNRIREESKCFKTKEELLKSL